VPVRLGLALVFVTCTHGHRHWGHLGAAGLLLVNSGHVLLQLRSRFVHQGGTWSIPGGAIEPGETVTAAALREAAEETGIPAEAVTIRHTHAAQCGGWQYVTAVGRLRQPPALLDNREGTARWIAVPDVDALPLHPAFRAAWPALVSLAARQQE
jgi:8-oxo-dGTP diphosphatase